MTTESKDITTSKRSLEVFMSESLQHFLNFFSVNIICKYYLQTLIVSIILSELVLLITRYYVIRIILTASVLLDLFYHTRTRFDENAGDPQCYVVKQI